MDSLRAGRGGRDIAVSTQSGGDADDLFGDLWALDAHRGHPGTTGQHAGAVTTAAFDGNTIWAHAVQYNATSEAILAYDATTGQVVEVGPADPSNVFASPLADLFWVDGACCL